MAVAPLGRGWQQRSHPLPQVVRNKISTHPDTLSTKIVKRKTHSSTHSETISKCRRSGPAGRTWRRRRQFFGTVQLVDERGTAAGTGSVLIGKVTQ
ncbi:hypothetical protein SMD11_6340 [Streptomyces albireticuli]|uniref:Uncharacterized protein n=1 Tax=Streptomyces albireticuli TaxID=1940 RepID=A0A1Z2LCA0_9ACTN|nr:hypothetical protein SMD11_6340 [Streptomyces albireticuli]